MASGTVDAGARLAFGFDDLEDLLQGKPLSEILRLAELRAHAVDRIAELDEPFAEYEDPCSRPTVRVTVARKVA